MARVFYGVVPVCILYLESPFVQSSASTWGPYNGFGFDLSSMAAPLVASALSAAAYTRTLFIIGQYQYVVFGCFAAYAGC
jgi:hypothetical protein